MVCLLHSPTRTTLVPRIGVPRIGCRYTRSVQVSMFMSTVYPQVMRLTGADKTGGNLPTYLAPWRLYGSTWMPKGDTRPEAATIRAVVADGGYCLIPTGLVP